MATQTEVAAHLLLTDRTIRDLQKMPGAPVPQGRSSHDIEAWTHFYIRYLRAQKGISESGSRPELSDDEEEAKALKLRESQLKIEEREERIAGQRAKRQIFERTYAPVGLIVDCVEAVAVALNARLEAIVPKLKQACPDLDIQAVDALQREIIAASNELADVKPDLSDYISSSDAGGDPWAVDPEEEITD